MADLPMLATLPGVEILQVGTWEASTGEFTCTTEDLESIVAAQSDPSFRAPVIRLGHTDDRFDGEPAVGTVRNMRVVGDRLLGDLTGMPAWLAAVTPSAFPSRSIEGVQNFTAPDGVKYPMVLTGLALLGVQPPAIESLADIAGLYGVAATAPLGGGTEFTLRAKEHPMPDDQIADPTVDANDSTPVESPNTEPRGGPMQLSDALKTRLGVETEDEAIAKITELEELATANTPLPPAEIPAAIPAGSEVVNTGILEELRVAAKRGEQAHETLRVQARDSFLDTAIRAGKFAPARKEHFAALFDADETGTRDLVENVLASGTIPLTEIGNGANTESTATDDAFFDAFFAGDPRFTDAQEG